MKNPTIVFPRPREVILEEREMPAPGRGEVVVRTECTLVSIGTELTVLLGQAPKDSAWERYGKFPFIPGYNNVGKVVEVGKEVPPSWLGQRVASYSPHAQYVVVNSEDLRPVPSNIPPFHAVFFTFAEIAMNGVRRGRVTWGESAVVYGLGNIGQLTVDFCRLAGARPVIGVDVSSARLAHLPGGPGVVGVNSREEDVVARVQVLTRGRMADVVFEATGDPEAIPHEFASLRRQGRLVVVSSPRGPCVLDLHDLCNSPSISIIGAHNSSHPRYATPESPWTRHRHCELFMDFLARGEIDVGRLISHRVSYREAPRVYQQLLEDRSVFMGVVMDWE